MLEPAIKYKEKVEMIQYDTWFNDRYKYWNNGSYYDSTCIATNTWDMHQFVSTTRLNEQYTEILGIISYNISRQDNSVYNLSVINFNDHNKFRFGKDLMQSIDDIFEKYRFRKLSFTVVIGNPIERSYDRMIKKYGGRIVGIQKDDVKLIDGKYYDRKIYEILASDYLKNKKIIQEGK